MMGREERKSSILCARNWNSGILDSWIGIALIEVGGASACGGLEAEGQEYFALCLSHSFLRINSVILKRGAPELKVMCFPFLMLNIPSFHHSVLSCFDTHYSITPTFHHSMWMT